MELNIKKFNIMDLPVEVRVGILKKVTKKSATRLRQASRQLRQEIENFYDFPFMYLSDAYKSQVKALLKFRIKIIQVDRFENLIDANNLPFLKHPYAVQKLCITNSTMLPQTYEILLRECGKYLREFRMSPDNFINMRGETWEVPPFMQSDEQTECLKNLQRLSINDLVRCNFKNNESRNILRNQVVLRILEIPLSMFKLKNLNISLKRLMSLDVYLQLRANIFRIVKERCETLEELTVRFFIKFHDLNTTGNDYWKVKNAVIGSNLKKLCLRFEFYSANDVIQKLAVESFHLLLEKQSKLEHLDIQGMIGLDFLNLMEIVQSNSGTLQRLEVLLEEGKFEETERLDFSAIRDCLKLRRLFLIGQGCEKLEVINFEMPKSLVAPPIVDGFQVRVVNKRKRFIGCDDNYED